MLDLSGVGELLGGAGVRDNPRTDGLARVAIIGGGAFILFRVAQQGGLGPAAKQVADSIWSGVPSSPVQVTPGGPVIIGAPGAPAPLPGPGGGGRPCPPFTAGVNYVQDNGDGTFETVVGGRSVYHGDRRTAEATYNTRMGCT